MNTETLTNSSRAPLISSAKVEGTSVFRSNGDKIGCIEKIVINKQSGHVAFALMASSGELGRWNAPIPVPWDALKFNQRLNGYELNLSDEQLEMAARFAANCKLDWDEPDAFVKVEGWFNSLTMSRFELAKQDVSKVFRSPEDIDNATDLSTDQKIFLLKQWETDLRLLMVASDENMTGTTPGHTAELLQKARHALARLGADDTEPGAVNKTGG